MKIVVLESLSVGEDISWEPLRQFGELTLCRDLTQNDIKEAIKDADIIIPNKLLINKEVLSGSSVKAVFEAATGYNNIDTDYCHKNNITVANVSGYATNSVVQHTIALLLSLYEKIDYYNTFVKDGTYSSTNNFSHFGRTFNELCGKRWGIAGLGAIGRKVATIATAFGCEVVYYSASGNTYDVPYKAVDFDTFLSTCDVITIHCPLNGTTKDMFNYEAFKKMQPHAVLVNVARGPIVNEDDLVRAINENLIAGAALDVFKTEPIKKDSPLLSIKDNSRLIMTPHNAWGSVESRTCLIEELCKNIQAYINGQERNLV